MLSSHESRMYAASILYVYEGDAEALETGIQSEAHDEVMHDEEEDEEEEEPQYISKTKLIDFAHASFRPGEGPDVNAVRGVENVLKHLKMLLE
jgi:inositol-polyphosphate multikinase